MAEPSAEPHPDAVEYRIRFVNFNMANSSAFASPADLPGHLGPGTFTESFRMPLADGKPVDLVFASMVETRAFLREWIQAYKASDADSPKPASSPKALSVLDALIPRNASKASIKKTDGGFQGVLEGFAAGYNGNLKTLLGLSTGDFEDTGQELFGRLVETTVMGMRVPNPKKAFTGTIVSARSNPEGISLCFVGAHFPVERIAEMLDTPGADALKGAKIAVAKILRKILRRGALSGVLDGGTILFLQGDLNSRTVLTSSGSGPPHAVDILQEVLKDSELQDAIQLDLPLPTGRWKEIVQCDARALPVTYKYSEDIGAGFKEAVEAGGGSGIDVAPLTIGDVLDAAEARKHQIHDDEIHRKTLSSVGLEQMSSWGLTFKEKGFRPFRFPAAADRVIYWAPFGLDARISWQLPRGGYKVNHAQGGSDHRPVSLEVVLRIAPPVEGGAGVSFQWGGASNDSAFFQIPVHHETNEVCEDDYKDSDSEL